MSTRPKGVWRGRRRPDPGSLVAVLAAAIVGYLALVPVLFLLWSAFVDDTGLTLGPLQRAFTDPRTGFGIGELLLNTLIYAAGSTVVACSVGTALAYLTERTDLPLRRAFFVLALVPAVFPGILYTIAWIFLASPRIGVLTRWLEPVLGPEAISVFGLPGMILVQGISSVPLVYLLMFAAFRAMDPSLEESALMSGAGLVQVIRRVTIPTVVPALAGTVLLTLARGFASFEEPALLGMSAGVWVFTSRTWQALQLVPPDFGQAAAYALGLLALSCVAIYFYFFLGRRARSFQTISGKGFRPRRMPLGRWRWPITAIVAVYFIVAIALPVLILVYMAFQPFYAPPSIESIANSSLRNFEYLFSSRVITTAFTNSFLLAIATAVVVMSLTAVVAWIVIRTRTPGRWLLDNLTFLPLLIPGLVVGVSLIYFYLRVPLPIYGTLWILLIAYCTQYMPYGMRYSSASMFQVGAELEESAQVSGASWWRVFWRIVMPLLAPGLIAGGIFVVMLAIRELATSLLLYSPGNEVLAVMIWNLYDGGLLGELAALGSILVVVLVLMAWIANQLGSRIGVTSA